MLNLLSLLLINFTSFYTSNASDESAYAESFKNMQLGLFSMENLFLDK
jgi:hypothetical protein